MTRKLDCMCSRGLYKDGWTKKAIHDALIDHMRVFTKACSDDFDRGEDSKAVMFGPWWALVDSATSEPSVAEAQAGEEAAPPKKKQQKKDKEDTADGTAKEQKNKKDNDGKQKKR